MSSATAGSRSGTLVLPARWLISRRVDLVFLIGSVLLSWSLFALWRYEVLTTAQLVLLWIFAFHGPHFWGTISRTYADPGERRRRGRSLRFGLLWFAVGPAFVAAGWAFYVRTGRMDGVLLFFFLAALWAYQHVVKQHFGFLALYRAKHGEFDRRELLLHKYYLIVSLWIPVVIVMANSDWIQLVPFVGWYAEAGGAPHVLAARGLLLDYGPAAFWIVQALFAGTLVLRVARGRGVNLPELAIIAASVSLHWVVVRAVLDPPAGDPLGYYALVPLVTIYHNVQYHALVWHYNTVKYRRAAEPQRFGLAARLNRGLGTYAACGLLFTVATIGVEHYGWEYLGRRDLLVPTLLGAAIWGYSFIHYWLDGIIWRVRGDEELRHILGLAAPRRAAGAAEPSGVAAGVSGPAGDKPAPSRAF